MSPHTWLDGDRLRATSTDPWSQQGWRAVPWDLGSVNNKKQITSGKLQAALDNGSRIM